MDMPINNEIIRILLNDFEKYNTNKIIHVRLIETQITQKLHFDLCFIIFFIVKRIKNSPIIPSKI